MSNSLLTISMITKESLRVLLGNLTMAKNVSRAHNQEFAVKGAKIGDTINIRKPARYVGRTGAVITSTEDHTETSTPLTIDQQYGVDLAFTSKERTLSLDMFSDRVVKPAMANIASRIDAKFAALASKVYNQVGTPGSALTKTNVFDAILDAGVKLDGTLTPRATRKLVVDPRLQATATAAGMNLFNPGAQIAKQYEDAQVINALGFDWYMNQNMPTLAASVYGGTPVVSGAGQTGSTLAVSGLTGSLKAGAVLTVAGVYAVDPQTKAVSADLQQFVVTLDTASGPSAVSISPAIVATGAFQNVSAAPAANAAITVAAATGVVSPVSLAFHEDAFVGGWADLEVPNGVHEAHTATDENTGISVRMVSQYDIINDRMITRFDTLFGCNVLYTELATRIVTR